MTRVTAIMLGAVLAVACTGTAGWAAESNAGQPDPVYDGRPLTQWLKSIQDRDKDMADAFDAIQGLGPLAWPAVPDLVRIVGAPFTPIQAGVDETDVVISKLDDIEVRAKAVDALASMGGAASASADVLIEWALTVRVVPGNLETVERQSLFIDLVASDILERMRVAGVVAEFGPGAASAVADLLASTNADRRKFGVAILSERALPVAADMLKSAKCENRELGFAMFADMWPVIAPAHLVQLKSILGCQGN